MRKQNSYPINIPLNFFKKKNLTSNYHLQNQKKKKKKTIQISNDRWLHFDHISNPNKTSITIPPKQVILYYLLYQESYLSCIKTQKTLKLYTFLFLFGITRFRTSPDQPTNPVNTQPPPSMLYVWCIFRQVYLSSVPDTLRKKSNTSHPIFSVEHLFCTCPVQTTNLWNQFR